MEKTLRSPAPAGAQAPRKSVQQDSSNGSEFKATHPATQADIKFHPLADIFPLMEGAEFDELVADIKAHGCHEDIVLFDGMILDGRNRYRACLAAGIPPCPFNGDRWIDDPAAYVISVNIHRRHLTSEQRRDLIVKLVVAQPEKSDREIAKIAKVSHPTVAKARRAAEATGKTLPVAKRVGADGKARRRPARPKDVAGKTAANLTKPTSEAAHQQQAAQRVDIGESSASECARLRAHVDELVGEKRRLEIKCAGLESEVEELKARNAELEAEVAKHRGPPLSPEVAQIASGLDAAIASLPLDTYLDPGPIPDCLRRDRGAA
jgi:ParB-like chromosome segregation protein Spo0J